MGGFTEAIAVHNAAQERGVPVWCGGMLETGIGRAHNIALSSLPNFSLPGDVSASSRYWTEDVIEPAVTVSKTGEIVVPAAAGSGFPVVRERIERLTVRAGHGGGGGSGCRVACFADDLQRKREHTPGG